MAEETNKSTKKVKPEQTKSPLTGAQTKATTLDSTTKLDIDTQKALIDMLIDAGTNSSFDYTALTNFTTISNNRDQIYQLIDTMMQDSSVSSVIRTFAEDATEVADNGHIMWCESSDPKISKFINYLLNVMNVDKNIYGWAYSLVTYGDVYLKLYRESDYEDPLFNKNNIETTYAARNVLNEDYKKELDESINISMHKISDPYSYYVEMVPNPGTMFELTKYGRTYGYVETPDMDLLNTFDYSTITNMAGAPNNLVNNYRMKSSDVNVYQADDYVHAFLADSESRYPEKVNLFYNEDDYKAGTNVHAFKVKRGKSMLYDSYKIWREKSLLESAILLTRLTRSSLIRKVQVEVGDMPKEQVKLTLRRVKELMEQKTALNTDQSMSEYTDPGAVINNIYFPTHNGQGAISVESIGGDYNPKELVDLDDWTNKFYSSYGIPKQYFGWTDDGAGFNGGTSLTILSSVYAKGVKRVQNALIQMVTDAISLFLINRGYKSYLNNFTLKMKAPLTQEEKDYREALSNKVNAVSNIQALFSDVESKERKLRIAKTLVSQLDYGDELGAIIQEEIDAAIAAEKQAKEEEAAAQAEETGTDNTDKESEDISLDDLDLGNSGDAPLESFSHEDNLDILTEDGANVIVEEDELPSAADIDIDLSRND